MRTTVPWGIDSCQPRSHNPGTRWQTDEAYVALPERRRERAHDWTTQPWLLGRVLLSLVLGAEVLLSCVR